ncbi:MAG: Na+/H+ antiporter NhaC family protein [Desulfobacterales bacterium]
MATKREKRDPYLWEALVSILGLIVFVSLAIVRYESDAQVPILLGVLVAAVIGLRAGFTWKEIETGMLDGITNSLQAIVILLIIGILIGVWILSGVVPTLLYYGLKILHPKIFLPAALIICSITSLATGTSWGTTGTIGIALIGIGEGLGFPLPVVAGAVLSGAYFGDKMSPLSDTTNLAPAMVGTDLYTHIKHMSSLMLIPPALVMILAIRKIPAVPGITIGILAAGIIGVIFQGNTFGSLLSAAYGGFASSSGVEAVDNLLTKGGFASMMYTVSLVICAMMFGGIMEKTNQLRVVVTVILKKAQSTGSLITATVLTAIGANLILCDQYMSIVMSGKMYAQSYKDMNLAPQNLSRAIEDSATVTANLVPWNTGGAYQAATLGVPTIAYLPFNFFCWISPIVTMLYGWFNITITPLDEEIETPDMATEQSAA